MKLPIPYQLHNRQYLHRLLCPLFYAPLITIFAIVLWALAPQLQAAFSFSVQGKS